jgi:hypothetical protein
MVAARGIRGTLDDLSGGAYADNNRLSMRHIKEVLRLRRGCQRNRHEVAAATGVSATTVFEYVQRMQRAWLSLEQAMNDVVLEAVRDGLNTQLVAVCRRYGASWRWRISVGFP